MAADGVAGRHLPLPDGRRRNSSAAGRLAFTFAGTSARCGQRLAPFAGHADFFRRFPHDLLPEPARRFNLRRGIFRTGHGDREEFRRIAEKFLKEGSGHGSAGKFLAGVLGLEFAMTALETLRETPEERREILPESSARWSSWKNISPNRSASRTSPTRRELSESRFATVFKRETGTTPMLFFNTVRLGHAQSFLLTDFRSMRAAKQAGFSSPQYFCRYFRKRIGVLPGIFRANPLRTLTERRRS